MATFVLRVWLPDRPGALGAVASRIGAVGGDVAGIEILERGAGRAIDELVIELPDPRRMQILLNEVNEVDGVDVEDVHELTDGTPDRELDALESAAALVAETTIAGLLDTLAARARRSFGTEWAAVVDLDGSQLMATDGAAPPEAWLAAFAAGGRTSVRVANGESGPEDVAWAPLEVSGLALVLGRHGRPFRVRERRQAAAVAAIADRRWAELAVGEARRVHPSAS